MTENTLTASVELKCQYATTQFQKTEPQQRNHYTYIPNIKGPNTEGSPNAMIMQSKVYVCGSLIAEIVGPNPAEGKNVLLSCFLCAVKVVDYATS